MVRLSTDPQPGVMSLTVLPYPQGTVSDCTGCVCSRLLCYLKATGTFHAPARQVLSASSRLACCLEAAAPSVPAPQGGRLLLTGRWGGSGVAGVILHPLLSRAWSANILQCCLPPCLPPRLLSSWSISRSDISREKKVKPAWFVCCFSLQGSHTLST